MPCSVAIPTTPFIITVLPNSTRPPGEPCPGGLLIIALTQVIGQPVPCQRVLQVSLQGVIIMTV